MTVKPFPTPEEKLKAMGVVQMPVPNPNAKESKFKLEGFGDIAFDPSEEKALVKGLLPAKGVAFIYGPPKSYKSFVALSVGLAVARGLPEWAGRKVQQGAVIYICCEGVTGARKRIAAYRSKMGLEGRNIPFYMISARPNLGTAEGDAAELIRIISEACHAARVNPAIIIIDTLVRTLNGGDENAAGAHAFLDNAERIAGELNCLTMAIHHTGKDAERGMRGSSALLGGADCVWKVSKDDNRRVNIVLEDAKDFETGLTWSADLPFHAFTVDEDGEEVGSLVVENISEPVFEESGAKGSGGRTPTSLLLFMSCVGAVMDRAQPIRPFLDGPEVKAVPISIVREEFYRRYSDDNPDSKPDSKRRMFNKKLDVAQAAMRVLTTEVNGEPMLWLNEKT